MTDTGSAPDARGQAAQAFAELLRRERRTRGWTQEDLSEAAGVSRMTIMRYESGDVSRANPDIVRALCRVLEIDMRRAIVALGIVTVEELGTLRELSLIEAIRQLEDPEVSEEVRWRALARLRSVIGAEPHPVDFDDATRHQIEEIALVEHTTVDRVVADLARAEYDRRFPGKREAAELPAAERFQQVLNTLGIPPLTDDPEADRALRESLDEADRRADLRYGRSEAA